MANYLTYSEWVSATVNKIVGMGLKHTPKEHVEDYLRIQIEAAIRQACRHGRSGRSDDELVVP